MDAQNATLAFLFSPVPATPSLLSWPSMDLDGPSSLPKNIQGGAPYAEHLLKAFWAEAGGTKVANPKERVPTSAKLCRKHLWTYCPDCSLWKRISVPAIWGRVLGPGLPMHWVQAPWHEVKSKLRRAVRMASSQPASSEQYVGAFPWSLAQHAEVSFSPNYKSMSYGEKIWRDLEEQADNITNLKWGKPSLGLSDSRVSFSALQVRSWVSACNETGRGSNFSKRAL